ncbi:MAG: hypothetical protein J6333_10060, partial [Planctomycetes bacterium]|nr:hypothetical protein [Planctomycetota bacterium]
MRIISRLAARVRGLEQEAAEAHLLAGNAPSITTIEGAAPSPETVAVEGGEPAPEPAPEPLPDREADEKLIEQLAAAAPDNPDPE